MNFLVTGGAGFIGSHLSRRLIELGHNVRILDVFSPQVHQGQSFSNEFLADHSEIIKADIRDYSAVERAIRGVDIVIHLAAETGTGQSMYKLERYESVNNSGTRVLVEALLNNQRKSCLKKIIFASSRSVYGEGAYTCKDHGLVYPAKRNASDLSAGHYDPVCPTCSKSIQVAPTPETAPFQPSSFYALTKQFQEQLILMYSKTLGVEAVSLRLQNVFGPGQSISNPYTGIVAIFSTLARSGKKIRIFEDGLESRDFVYIDDVVNVFAKAAFADALPSCIYNVGSGIRTSVLEVAGEVCRHYGISGSPIVTGEFREGDIRHCYADLELTKQDLSYVPRVRFVDGLKRVLEWADNQSTPAINYYESLRELSDLGLFLKPDKIS